MTWESYPPDGRKFARKNPSEAQTSLLPWPTSMPSSGLSLQQLQVTSAGALATDRDYVYLVGSRVLRIAKSESGRPSILKSPELVRSFDRPAELLFCPGSVAVSPDGKWLYLTYTAFNTEKRPCPDYLPCVMRMPSDCSREPEIVIGEATPQPKAGAVLSSPSDLAFDREGRLCVTDRINGLLIFSTEGKLLHQVDVDSPARIQVDPKTGDLWVTGWALRGVYSGPQTGRTPQAKDNVMLYRLTPGTANAPPAIAQSFVIAPDTRPAKITEYGVVLDFQNEAMRIWFSKAHLWWGGDGKEWRSTNARILTLADGKFKELTSFEDRTNRDVVQSRPPRYGRQRPYANPVDGCVYIAEQIQPTVVSDVQCFDQLVRVDPNTGKCSMVDLPFDTEDMAFDSDGMAYLRTDSIVSRYDPGSWREVPFDYGMEFNEVTHYGLKPTKAISVPYFRGGRGASGKIFGMGVNAKGDVAVSFYSTDVSNVEMAGEGNPEIKRPEINVASKNVNGKVPVMLGGAKPWRPPDAIGMSGYRGNVWLEGADWMLGGLGANGRDLSARVCHCEANTGIALDDYGRSFVPAIHRYEVVVVDTAGNIVLRIGRYGNVDDGVPLVKDGGPANPRSFGGDEVALVSPKWLGVHSDRRLFISDRGNYRILSVKLGYHAEEKASLGTQR